jgi:hypothetical protein
MHPPQPVGGSYPSQQAPQCIRARQDHQNDSIIAQLGSLASSGCLRMSCRIGSARGWEGVGAADAAAAVAGSPAACEQLEQQRRVAATGYAAV